MEKSTQIALKLDRLQMLHHACRRRAMHRIGLWRGQMPIMEYVLLHEGCTQASLAQTLGLSAATVAVSTKRLSRAGFLVKKSDPDNLRCNQLYLTDAGKERIGQGQALCSEHNRRTFGALTETQQEAFLDLLDRLILSLGESAEAESALENLILMKKLSEEEEAKDV